MSRHSASHFHKSKTLNDKYILGDEIGKGAYGRVYKGLDLENGDFVAIKQVSLENIPPEDLASIMQEIDLLKNLNHKNIVKYQGSIKTRTHLYIILEYVENGSLANMVKPNKFGAFPESLVALYISQVLEGLAYLHEQGVIHRDIKGANILTTKEGLVKLADFGVATKLTEADINTHSVVGTPYWMAPEVIEMSGVSAASDIWSVGCTVIELLTCIPPYYELQAMSALFRIVQDEHPPIPEHLSAGITDFLHQCFRKESKLRPDAKTLLKHSWIRNSRRALQNSLRHGAQIGNIPQDLSTVLERSIKDSQKEDQKPLSQESVTPVELGSDDDAKSKSPVKQTEIIKVSSSETNGSLKSSSHPDDKSQGEPNAVPSDSVSTVVNDIEPATPSKASPTVSSDEQEDANNVVSSNGKLAATPEKLELAPHREDEDVKILNPSSRGHDIPVLSNGSHPSQPGKSVASTLCEFSDTPADSLLDDLFEGQSMKGPSSQIESSSTKVPSATALAEKLNAKMAQNRLEGQRTGENLLSAIMKAVEEEEIDASLGFERNSDYYAKQAVEVTRLVQSLRPDEQEDVVVSNCQKLVTIFREYPSQKSHLVSQHGVMPLMEMLEVNNNRVVHAVLQLVNQLVKDSIDIQENACLVGLIPVVMSFAAPERAKEVRMQAAFFVQQMCNSSPLTLQMFIACRGLPVLVGFLEPDYAKYREMVHLAIDCMWQIFELRSPTPRNDFCRIFSKSGVLVRLVNTLHSLNEASRLAPTLGAGTSANGSDNTKRARSGPLDQSRIFSGHLDSFRPRSGQLDPLRVRHTEYGYGLRHLSGAPGSPKAQKSHLLQTEMRQQQQQQQQQLQQNQMEHGETGKIGHVRRRSGSQERLHATISENSTAEESEQMRASNNVGAADKSWQQMDASNNENLPHLLTLLEKEPPSGLVSGYALSNSEKSESFLPLLHHSNPTRKTNGDLEMLMTAFAEKGDMRALGLNYGQEGSSSSKASGMNSKYLSNATTQTSSNAFAEVTASTSGLVSQSASGLLSVSGVLNGRPGSATSSGLLTRMVTTMNSDVAKEYLGKVADLILEFSQADTVVKSSMCSLSLLIRLFTMLTKLDPPILLKILKCIKQLSKDPYTLEYLQRADAMKHLVPFLESREGPHASSIHTQVLNSLYNLCKINKRRQEQAAECGIIPHLMRFINANSPLKQFALPLLCDMAHASRYTREQLRVHKGLDVYLNLLDDEYWAVTALDSLAVCLAHDNEHRKVEQALLKKDSVQKLVTFFECCSGPSFVHILEPFLKIITKSSRLNTALAISGLTPLLVGRLDHQDAIARLNLLKLIKAVYEHHPRPKQLIVEHDLPSKLQKLIEERRDGERSGGQVLVKQMATALLKALHINTVL